MFLTSLCGFDQEREKRLVRTSFFLALTMIPIGLLPDTPQTDFWLRKTCFGGALALSICPFLFRFWPYRKYAKTVAASFFCTVLLGLNVVITSSLGGWPRICAPKHAYSYFLPFIFSIQVFWE
jgi:hypothetical protein